MIELGENNPMASIDAGQHVVFVWYEVRRPQPEGSDRKPVGIRHTQLTETYCIVEGSATLRTGGRLTSERRVEFTACCPGRRTSRDSIH